MPSLDPIISSWDWRMGNGGQCTLPLGLAVALEVLCYCIHNVVFVFRMENVYDNVHWTELPLQINSPLSFNCLRVFN